MNGVLTILQENISAVFALAGTIAGAALSFFTAYALKRRESGLHLQEQILERRIQAHEQVIHLALSMRAVLFLGYRADEAIRAPFVTSSPDEFDRWQADFYQVLSLTTWLSTELTRELNYLQDYIVNLYIYLRQLAPDDYGKAGVILRNDFIEFSSRIENLALDFLAHDLAKLRLGDLRGPQKYPTEETKEKLMETALFSKSRELQALLQQPQPPG